MSISQIIQQKINRLAEGSTFKYNQLALKPEELTAATKTMERLVTKGVIGRISKGLFYKPRKTVFGNLKPTEEELLKPYLFENGKRVAYITGTSLYNKMGLTTQVPTRIKIACRRKRITISSGSLQAIPASCYVDISDSNYYLLELLDALKDFKQIADLNKLSAIKILTGRLRELTPTETKQILNCSLAYPPRVRALLGALLEKTNSPIDLTKLSRSLNPLSEFDYHINGILPTAKNWRII